MNALFTLYVCRQLRGEFLKETKVCTVISPRPGPSTAAEGDEAQDTLVTKQVSISALISSSLDELVWAGLPSQRLWLPVS